MSENQDEKPARVSRAAQRASQSETQEPSANSATPAPPQPGSQPPKKPKSVVGIILASGCLLLTLVFFSSPGLVIGFLWNLLTSSSNQNNYDQDPIEQSSNAPAVQAFLNDVSRFASRETRYKDWTASIFAYGMNCPDAGDPNGDACYSTESIRVEQTDDEGACREVFKIAEQFGVESDLIIGETDGQAYGEASLKRCVTMLSSYPRSVGWGWFGPEYYIRGLNGAAVPWVMMLTRTQQTSPEPSSNNADGKLNAELYGYSLIVGTNFGDAYSGENEGPDYADNKVQAAAMLDTVAYYRRSNKALGFFTKALVDQVLPIYKEIFRFDGKVKSFAAADGSIHWVQMNFKDGSTWCISIGEGKDLTTGGDATLGMGMDETGLPGGTVELAGLGSKLQSQTDKHKFGDYVVGVCK